MTCESYLTRFLLRNSYRKHFPCSPLFSFSDHCSLLHNIHRLRVFPVETSDGEESRTRSDVIPFFSPSNQWPLISFHTLASTSPQAGLLFRNPLPAYFPLTVIQCDINIESTHRPGNIYSNNLYRVIKPLTITEKWIYYQEFDSTKSEFLIAKVMQSEWGADSLFPAKANHKAHHEVRSVLVTQSTSISSSISSTQPFLFTLSSLLILFPPHRFDQSIAFHRLNLLYPGMNFHWFITLLACQSRKEKKHMSDSQVPEGERQSMAGLFCSFQASLFHYVCSSSRVLLSLSLSAPFSHFRPERDERF